jgi:cell filamentation protein
MLYMISPFQPVGISDRLNYCIIRSGLQSFFKFLTFLLAFPSQLLYNKIKPHKDVNNMLQNKPPLTDSASLAREEEKISKEKALACYKSGFFDTLEPGTFHSLSEIHRVLFEDIYDFAGKLRTEKISKGNFRFASVMYLAESVKQVEKMPQLTFDNITEKYVEMNVCHPFREGNGRSMRIWLDLMFKKELGKVTDWSRIDKEDYLLAMERSPIRDTEIKYLLKNALTDKTDDREVFMKGIDMSYYYEGYNTFKIWEVKSEK